MTLTDDALRSFLLALSALFSIVNPPSTALIFREATAERSHEERLALANRIAVYAGLVMLVSLWGGAYVLAFFGLTIDAVRIGGGLVVAVRAWEMLAAPEVQEERKQGQAEQAQGIEAVAFFPLTLPFTTGPGTISVAIALGSNLPAGEGRLAYVLGASAAAVAIAAMIWIAYRSADRLMGLLGAARARVIGRLNAFLLLCIGIQIALNGITAVLRATLQG